MTVPAPVWTGVLAAAGLWGAMFGLRIGNFWLMMSISAGVLALWSILHQPRLFRSDWHFHRTILWGVGAAVFLYGLFFAADKITRLLMSFQDEQVRSIYGLRLEGNRWLIGALLLFLIGPAEEIFWRGFIQRRFSGAWGGWLGFLVATAIYTAVHIPSMNLMLIGAAGVCGLFWGWLYLHTQSVLPGMISHSLWDVAVFVLFPFR